MAYSTFAQFQETYSPSLLSRLCLRAGEADTGDPTPTQVRSEAALDAAAGQMDTFFVQVYPVPLSTSHAPTLALLRKCCENMAVASLVRENGYVTGSEDEQLLKGQYAWLDWLASIRNGKTSLPGVSADAVGEGQVTIGASFVVESEDPFFPPASRFC